MVHCAGRGGAVRVVERDGSPGSLEAYAEVVTINLIGTFNVLRLAAARMARQRAGRRRARRRRPDRVGRRLRGADRPDPVRGSSKAGHRRHDARRGARPGQQLIRVVHDRARHLRHADAGAAARRRQGSRWPSRAAPEPARPARRVRQARAGASSTTRCSTARRSGSTARSGWRRDERPAIPARELRRRRRSSRSTARSGRNAIDLPTAEAIGAALDRLDERDDAGRRRDHRRRAGLLRRHGPEGVRSRRAPPDRPAAAAAFGIVERPPAKPLIAAVEGYALAGGFEIVLACDLIVAADDARSGCPRSSAAWPRGGGAVRLPQRIPYSHAMRMILTGEPISARARTRSGW